MLVRRGHTVRALVRRPTQPPALESLGVELVPGGLADPAALAALTRRANAVVHLVGIIVEAGRAPLYARPVGGTPPGLQAPAPARGERVVRMSAVRARDEPGATPYHRTKWHAEQLVRASGLSHAVFRPSIISGPENAPIRTLARLHRWSPVVPVFGDGHYPTQPVWVEDVALAFALAVEQPTLSGAFELGGPQVLTYEEFLLAIGRAAGHPRPLVHLPLALARAATAAFGVLGAAAPLKIGRAS